MTRNSDFIEVKIPSKISFFIMLLPPVYHPCMLCKIDSFIGKEEFLLQNFIVLYTKYGLEWNFASYKRSKFDIRHNERDKKRPSHTLSVPHEMKKKPFVYQTRFPQEILMIISYKTQLKENLFSKQPFKEKSDLQGEIHN